MGGASGVAAVLAGLCPELKGKKVVIALCGGNIDTTILGRCLDRGMAADGRLVKFSCTISDRPGGMAELTNCLFRLGVTIKDIQQERAWLKNDIFSVSDTVVVETRDSEHAQEMVAELKKNFENLCVTGLNLTAADESDNEDSGIGLSPQSNGHDVRRGSHIQINTSHLTKVMCMWLRLEQPSVLACQRCQQRQLGQQSCWLLYHTCTSQM